ncbi:MAG: OmpA family protein [Bacteroidia bacterium]|nr:OmpA family protein [Bacteroidia bacterium]
MWLRSMGLSAILLAQPSEVLYRVEVTTIAGSGRVGYRGGAALEAALNRPNGIVADQMGNVYFSDDQNHCVRKVTPAGQIVLVAGRPQTAGYADGPSDQALLNSPHGLTLDPQGNLYVCDYLNHAIRKITPQGNVSTLAGGSGRGFKDGVGKAAQFSLPIAIVRDSKGNLWVLDGGNHALRKVSPQGKVETIAGTGMPGYEDGPGRSAQFNTAVGLTIDKQDNLYVVDAGNRCIRKVTPSGEVSTFIDLSFQGWTIRGTAGRSLSFSTSGGGYGGGITVDPDGNLYIADGGRHLIYQINPKEKTVEILAGTGRPGWIDGNGRYAQFYEPVEICLGEKPNIFYVCDYRNAAIRRIIIEKVTPAAADTSRPSVPLLLIVRVREESSRQPVAKAEITASPNLPGFPLTTNSQGEAQLQLTPGDYALTLTVEKEGYLQATKEIRLREGRQEVQILLRRKALPFTFRVVESSKGTALGEVQIELRRGDTLLQTGVTSPMGTFPTTLTGMAEVVAQKKGYFPFVGKVELRPGDSLMIALVAAEAGAFLRESRIHFKPSSPQLEPTSYSLLDRIAEFLKNHPEIRLRIHGHTDIGDRDPNYNQRLSEERAKAVRQYLIQKGVEPERLEAVGHGNKRPIADNSTPEGRAQNRRVEFEVISP